MVHRTPVRCRVEIEIQVGNSPTRFSFALALCFWKFSFKIFAMNIHTEFAQIRWRIPHGYLNNRLLLFLSRSKINLWFPWATSPPPCKSMKIRNEPNNRWRGVFLFRPRPKWDICRPHRWKQKFSHTIFRSLSVSQWLAVDYYHQLVVIVVVRRPDYLSGGNWYDEWDHLRKE